MFSQIIRACHFKKLKKHGADYKKDIDVIVRLDIIETCFCLSRGETLQEPTVEIYISS